MTALTVRLLGFPDVTYDGRSLSFRTRKVLALLVYLLVERGMHSRASLAALLWPETDARRASVTLRGTLSRLRRTLRPAGDVLLTEPGRVGFDTGCDVDLDLEWLETEASGGAGQEVGSSLTADRLTPILELDRGEFLAGFSLPDAPEFDNWAAVQRQLCQQRVETIYERLTRLQLAMGSATEAGETAIRWLARAPLNERAYRRLMAAQALAGDRAAAISTYDRCRAILENELAVSPSRETEDLASRIRAEAASVSSDRARTPSSPSMPFVGRADAQRQLAGAFRSCIAEGAGACVVIGAGGVGKTRLLQAFQEWVVLDTPTVEICQGRAFEMGGRLPYEPVIDALRPRLEREDAPEELLEDVWLAELSQLMPELRSRHPDLLPPMTGDPNFMRSRLFAAVAALGSALAARQPVIFVLDDMQWADSDTWDMVHYLVRRWAERRAPILLLLSARQEDFAANAALREWIARLERDVTVTRILLNSLSGTEVQQLVDGLAARGADEASSHEFSGWLWAETGGLPFYIEALVQMLIEQDVLTVPGKVGDGYALAGALQHVRSVDRVPLPPGVRDVILARLASLSAAEEALLLAAAVLGRECSFERMCQVANLGELAALPALESLLDGRLLAEKRAARRPYTPAHDYVREVTYDQCGEARRRVLHRRALIALEADGAPAAECAYHAAASLLDEPTFHYSLDAGDDALAAYALQESLGHYDRARDVARTLGVGTAGAGSKRLQRLYLNRGRVLELVYQYDAAQANYEELADLAESYGDSALRLASLTARSVIHSTHTPMFDPPLARELAGTAVELARKLDDRAAEAKALWCMMMVEFHTAGDSRKVLSYGKEAAAIAREIDQKDLEGYALSSLSWTYMSLERLEEARRANTEAWAVWRALGNLPMVADTYSIKLGIHHLSGEYDALFTTGVEAVRLSERIENSTHHWFALNTMGEAHAAQGDFGQAIQYLEDARVIGEGMHGPHSVLYNYQSQIMAFLMAGSPARAELWADRLYPRRDEIVPLFRTKILVSITRVKIALGSLDEAEAHLQQAFDRAESESWPGFRLAPLIVADAYLRLDLGEPQRALDQLDTLIPRQQRIGSRYHLAEAFWLKGRACLALARVGPARQAFMEARTVAEITNERPVLWQVLIELAKLAAEQGDSRGSLALYREAREIVRYIADHMDDRELADEFLRGAAWALERTPEER